MRVIVLAVFWLKKLKYRKEDIMRNKSIYVIGDGFKNFSNQCDVYTFSELINAIYDNNGKAVSDIIILGQGLNTDEKKILSITAKSSGSCLLNENELVLADSDLIHKHRPENSMVTEPNKQIGEQVYLSWLFINDDCAEMSDHVTGQHIQGMVLTEAARQMMLAVAEKYLLDKKDKGKSYCALLKVHSTFHKFAFPIETAIKHKILIFSTNNNGRYQAKTRTEFYQNNEMVTHVDIDYLFNNEALLLEKERSMARKTLEASLNEKSMIVELKLVA